MFCGETIIPKGLRGSQLSFKFTIRRLFSGERNMKKKNRKNKSILLRLAVLGVFAYMIFTLAGLWSTLNESRTRLSEYEEQYAESQNDIDELKAMLEEGSEYKIIEKAARERLGYVYPDEQVFIDISGN